MNFKDIQDIIKRCTPSDKLQSIIMIYIALLFVGLVAGANLKNNAHGNGHAHSGHGHAYGHLNHESSHTHYSLLSSLNNNPCGSTPSEPHPKEHHSSYIIGGNEAKANSLPWQVALYEGSYYICGGSLVRGANNILYVVTAAHCIGKGKRYRVALGAHNRHTESLTMFDVLSTKSHERYSSITLENDIAVLTLSQTAIETDKIRPICITETDPESYIGSDNCLVSGWGTTDSGSLSSTLQYVYKPLMSKQECGSLVNGFKSSNMICAGIRQGGIDSCQGDSGGPYSCKKPDGSWELVGIVSWGYGCAQPNSPGVYSDVKALRSWLLTNIGL